MSARTPTGYRGTGHAKLLLFGEHAAVYGYPAVGVGLPDATSLVLTPTGTASWDAPDLPAPYRPWFEALTAALEAELGRDAAGARGRVSISSTVPPAQGFGSSAGLCVAFAQAVLQLLKRTHDERRAWSLANRLERVFHGTPSGIDTGLALRRGVTAFTFDGGELPSARSLSGGDFHVVAASVPRSAGTKELVGAIAARMREGDERTRGLLAELGSIAAAACDTIPVAIDNAGRARLAAQVDQAHLLLEALGLGDERLDRCLTRGVEAGALAGKMSGAGGGGAFYLLCNDGETAAGVARELGESALVDPTIIRSVRIRDGQIESGAST